MTETALVINADDAGFDPAVDEAILESARRGILTSASVAVIGATAASFIESAKQLNLGLGLHFNITEGRPLTSARSLIAADGGFYRPKRVVWELASEGRLDQAELVAEARAQFDRLRSFGVEPDHVDSHNHLHCYRDVLTALVTALNGQRIHIRVPDEPECPPEICPPMPEPRLSADEMHEIIRKAGALSLSRFVGFAFSMTAGADSVKHLEKPASGGTEWMVHPGIRRGTLFTESPDRANESIVLQQMELIERLETWGYRRCRFGDLQ